MRATLRESEAPTSAFAETLPTCVGSSFESPHQTSRHHGRVRANGSVMSGCLPSNRFVIFRPRIEASSRTCSFVTGHPRAPFSQGSRRRRFRPAGGPLPRYLDVDLPVLRPGERRAEKDASHRLLQPPTFAHEHPQNVRLSSFTTRAANDPLSTRQAR